MEGQSSIEPEVDKDKATKYSKKCSSFPQVPFHFSFRFQEIFWVLFTFHFDFTNFLGDFCFEAQDFCDFTNLKNSCIFDVFPDLLTRDAK